MGPDGDMAQRKRDGAWSIGDALVEELELLFAQPAMTPSANTAQNARESAFFMYAISAPFRFCGPSYCNSSK